MTKGVANTHETFLSRLEKQGDCLVYTGHRDTYGYGVFPFDGGKWVASRYSYTKYVGDIPEGLLVRHTCDNPPCVLPSHLRTGTAKENNNDMYERGRDNRKFYDEECKKGHPRTEENTYINPSSGYRSCRVCEKAWHKEENRIQKIKRQLKKEENNE